MESIIRNVSEIGSDDRRAIEHVIGMSLADNQRIIISVAEPIPTPGTSDSPGSSLPSWCNVFDGLSDKQIAEIESVALRRANLSRSFE